MKHPKMPINPDSNQGYRPSDAPKDPDLEKQIQQILDFQVDESRRIVQAPVEVPEITKDDEVLSEGFVIHQHVNPLLITFNWGALGGKPD